MNCPVCQKALSGDFKFCPYCGVELNKNLTCPSCHGQVKPEWVSCPQCGTGLKAAKQQPLTPPPNPYQQPYSHGQNYGNHHGHHYGSSSSGHRHRRKGFLGHLFSS